MIILGLDPGLRYTGWGVIDYKDGKPRYLASGTIESSDSKKNLALRLVDIHDALHAVLDTWSPETAAVEETFVNNNGKTTLKLGQARAVSLLVPALNGVEVFEYSTNLIKKSVVGSGHAGKEQMQMMMKMLLPNSKIGSEHEADALATALCHAHHYAHKKLSDTMNKTRIEA